MDTPLKTLEEQRKTIITSLITARSNERIEKLIVPPYRPDHICRYFCLTRKAERTRKAYAYALGDYFNWNLPKDPQLLDERINNDTVRHWLDRMKVNGLKATSIHQKFAALSGLCDLLVELELLNKNPCKSKFLQNKPKLPDWKPSLGLTTEQIVAMGEACRKDPDPRRGKRDLALIALGFIACLRISELRRVSIEDFFSERGQTRLKIPLAKGKDDDEVGVDEKTKSLIESWLLEMDGGQKIKVDWEAGRKKTPVFVSLSDRTQYQRLSISAISKIIKKRAEQGGIIDMNVNSHLLRHAGITHLAELGWPLVKIQDHARHSDPRMTQRYITRLGKVRKSPASALGCIFAGEDPALHSLFNSTDTKIHPEE